MSKQTLYIANQDFFEQVEQQLATASELLIPIKGTSMHPFLQPQRDKVLLTPAKHVPLHKGMILLCQLPNRAYVLHRLIGMDGSGALLLQGDAALGQVEKVQQQQVIAYVKAVQRGSRWIDVSSLSCRIYACMWPKQVLLRKFLLKLWRKWQSFHYICKQ